MSESKIKVELLADEVVRITTSKGMVMDVTLEKAVGRVFYVKNWQDSDPRQLTYGTIVFNPDSEDARESEGVSILNPEDIYDLEKGKKQAFRNALKDLPREERKDAWEALLHAMAYTKAVRGMEDIYNYWKLHAKDHPYMAVTKKSFDDAVNHLKNDTGEYAECAERFLNYLDIKVLE